jgi:hypothetical protein
MLGLQVPVAPAGGGGGGSVPPAAALDAGSPMRRPDRVALESQGYGWGGRRPGQPWDPSLQQLPAAPVPRTLGAQLNLRSRRPVLRSA